MADKAEREKRPAFKEKVEIAGRMIPLDSNTGHPIVDVREEVATPEMCDDWLKRLNEKNRKITDARVDKFVRVLESNDWKLTPDAFGFDYNNEMTNGQHRAMAIFLSGIAAPVIIARGLDPDSRLVTDQGKARQFHEQLTISEGVDIPKQAISTARSMAGGVNGVKSAGAPDTIQEMRRFLGRHWDAILFAEELIGKQTKGISKASVKAVIARAYYHGDREETQPVIRKFAYILLHGTNEDGTLYEGDTAAQKLREYLITSEASSDSKKSKETYLRTTRALQYFMDRRPVRHRIEPVIQEIFLLPEEVAAAKAKRIAESKVKLVKKGAKGRAKSAGE